MKQQKDIYLEVILNYLGINQVPTKKINQHLFFHLIINKNILLEMIIHQFIVAKMKVQDLDMTVQKFIYIEL